ncbi:MAG TPA: SRPBCC family protein [Chthoniobacteraceae bacterium]|nr:SRPBCC family protein [Chthoniobacteraceae bacterium]
MTTHEFTAEQWLPIPRDELFSFFADAANLEALTPPWLGFSIITPVPIAMRPGALIDYRLRVRGVPLRWRTEITAWEPPVRFVDEQIRGPFRRWIHEHRFEPRDGGTLAVDRLRYAVPGGALINWLIVRHDVARIFAFRTAKLRERFAAARSVPG